MVGLFVPCFVDLFWPEVAEAAARVLLRAGADVDCPRAPRCCGQPALTVGDRPGARAAAAAFVDAFADFEAVVTPSGSCAAMVVREIPGLLAGTSDEAAAHGLARRTFELSQYLVDELGRVDVGARFPATVAYHDGCHTLRQLGVEAQPRALLGAVRDLTVRELSREQLCCGFGGTFAVSFPDVALAMADERLDAADAVGVDAVVSADPSCLLHLRSRAQWRAARGGASGRLPLYHLAQVLDSAAP